MGKNTLQCFQSTEVLQSKCTWQRSALPWLLSSRREVLLPVFPPDALEASWRGKGTFLPASPFPSKRLSDIGRVCDLSEEKPATYPPCPSANTQPLQVQKEAVVRQTPRGPWLEKHIRKARQKGTETGSFGSARHRCRQAGEREAGER